ncbi:MAG: cob(I)yrinic acid a,c-diamide adenosyltransferase [Gemmatimonadota bacterium]|nr:cob(I)yrinic acid a,c-diamide adenosyltransferase [Gemmatimonadota bacterium]
MDSERGSKAKWGKGYLQVYTGDGKGKTTAALGLALRAAGAGVPVFFSQFIKGMHYSEIAALERFPDLITSRQYGRGCFIKGKPKEKDIELARKGLEELRPVVSSGRYRLVILDEANVAVRYGLFTVEELLEVMDSRARGVEIVLTGRDAHEKVLERADLVTEMLEIKHYFTQGVKARTGIEK